MTQIEFSIQSFLEIHLGLSMMNEEHDYMTTAEVARDLDLSIGTVQRLVTIGELQALRTQGGHRRIFLNSVQKYRDKYGYQSSGKAPTTRICILNQGDNFDLMATQIPEPKLVKVLSHPLDLLNIDEAFNVLFIDANNDWLKSIPAALVDDLINRYTVFVYSSDELPEDSRFRSMESVHKIPYKINSHFVSGYLAGREAMSN